MKRFSVALVAFGATLGVALPGVSRADVFQQTSDHCSATSGACTIDTANTVTITQSATGVVDVKVSLDTHWFLIHTGAGDDTFAFSSTLSGLTLAVQSDTASFASWTTATTTSIKMDGLVFPATAYGLTAPFGPNDLTTGFLDFTVSATGLTVQSFINSLNFAVNNGGNPTGDNAIFAADVSAANGNTGIIDWSTRAVPGPLAGAGLPGLIAACAGLVAFARRRRHSFA
jgi:hypothetical protein